jgi:hypothetical protein
MTLQNNPHVQGAVSLALRALLLLWEAEREIARAADIEPGHDLHDLLWDVAGTIPGPNHITDTHVQEVIQRIADAADK